MTDRTVSSRSPIIVLGASWGGLHALSVIVGGLAAAFPVPLAVVQHRSRDAQSILRELLQDRTPLTVCEVEDKQAIEPGYVYLAPADYHLLVEGHHFSLTVDEPVRFSRPSIDVTLASAADSCGASAVGVVLTGANEDGAAGLRRIVDRGGRAVVQDPDTAEIRTMPAAARRRVPEAAVLPLEAIAGYLTTITGAHPAAGDRLIDQGTRMSPTRKPAGGRGDDVGRRA